MSLMKITDLTSQLGLSSRSLRYYEQVGLIRSVRPEFEKYRYYDADNIERLKQILVLRKLQIPVRDILRIYESEDMSVVVETFVSRVRAIEDEIGALAELKRITGEFLQTMLDNGVTKISAIPLLYEEMDKQLALMEQRKPVTMAALQDVSDKLARPLDVSIVDLPPMRVLTSFRDPDTKESDFSGFSRYIQANGLSRAAPGAHERFEFQTEAGDVLMVRVPEDFVNDSEYMDDTFTGGLFAAVNVYLDEDLGECFRALVRELDANPYYQFAYCADGTSRHPTLLENLISPDEKRELVSLLAPVKKRLPDPALFDAPEEVADITVAEIEAANPALWEVDVPLDMLTPINGPHYRVLDTGEAEYTGWISTRVLNTNVSVKLPFRVDIEFRVDEEGERFGYGDAEGSLVFYHSEDNGDYAGGDMVRGFGVNMNNRAVKREEALSFWQPVFGDFYSFAGRGKIKPNEYNTVTWIVGETHLAVIINGEIRYCGVHFPYMSLDFRRQPSRPVIVGSNGQGMKYFRSIRVSQLAETKKTKIKEGVLTMVTKQSNNLIPIIHRLVTDELGENYWFNGCASYVMECLGEPDYDYQFFAGLTGDVFTQSYSLDGKYRGNGISEFAIFEGNTREMEGTFNKCGYAATFVSVDELGRNTEMYLQTLIAYIDKGVPVISWDNGGTPVGVFVGYEEYGKVLLYITGNSNEPARMPLEKAITAKADFGGWIFVGGKKESIPLAAIYREAIQRLPRLLTTKNERYCCGEHAFRAWANDVERGKFDGMKPEDFESWSMYLSFVCDAATNGSCCHEFLKRARELNPDMGFLEEVSRLYRRMAEMWGGEGEKNDEDSLEALGGGFNVTLEALQDKERRGKIAAKLREFAVVTETIVRVLIEGLANEKLNCETFE